MAAESLGDFEILWIWNGQELAHDTLEFTLNTGTGTMFDAPADYLITLQIVYPDDLNTLRSSDEFRLSLLDPRLIASPGGLLLVLLALVGLGVVRWRLYWR
jgi:hypothetical protein